MNKLESTQETSDFNNTNSTEIYTHFQGKSEKSEPVFEEEIEIKKCCAVHPEYPPFYVCTVCENIFCKICPASVGNKLKICPFCGGECALYSRHYWEFNEQKNTEYDYFEDETIKTKNEIKPVNTKLELTDFLAALMYPFYHPLSLLVGAVLFFILVFGQIVSAFSGGWTMFGALALIPVILMLKFGVFLKTLENFTQANFQNSFMPRIKKFTIWEDFVNPFIVSVGVYLVSFGLFMVLAVSLGFYAWFSFAGRIETIETEMIIKGNQVNSILDSNNSDKTLTQARETEQKEMINEARLRQFESVFGHNHLLESEQLGKLIKSVMSLTLTFQMPIIFAFILGILYFPAVCLTLDKTRSFRKILQFKAGFKEIKKLGIDYIKILLMCFIFIFVLTAVVVGMFSAFAYMEIPLAGILSAMLAGSILVFYFWLVFSGVLGITVCKRLENT